MLLYHAPNKASERLAFQSQNRVPLGAFRTISGKVYILRPQAGSLDFQVALHLVE